MQLHTFGRSSLEVTRLGLGLAALGRPGYINLGHAQDLNRNYAVAAMEQHCHDVLDTAFQAGIRYFDAARSYGRAEQFLSSWLATRRIGPNEVVVGSKWGYTYTAGWQVRAERHEIKEHSLQVLQRQIGESLAYLGPHLDLYQIHSATQESGVLQNRPVLAKLASLRNDGMLIGLSTSGPAQSEMILRAIEIDFDGEPLFDSVQATWNLLSQEAGAALQAAHEAGMGIIVKEALANGRLTPRNQAPGFSRQRERLGRIAQKSGSTIDAIALAAVLAQPWADIVLSGAAAEEHLESNLKAVDLELGTELDELLSGLREEPDTYWGIRSDLDWN